MYSPQTQDYMQYNNPTPSNKSKSVRRHTTLITKETIDGTKTASTFKQKQLSSAESKVFKNDHILFVFEDNQYIQTGSEEKKFRDATQCYKFNLTDRLKKYFFYVEGLSPTE